MDDNERLLQQIIQLNGAIHAIAENTSEIARQLRIANEREETPKLRMAEPPFTITIRNRRGQIMGTVPVSSCQWAARIDGSPMLVVDRPD